MSKIIVIEGTDCSGKETQTKMIVNKLKRLGKKVVSFSFPMYDTPTGKIIGGPLLGKPEICGAWFEDPSNVDPKIASLYYAADRRFSLDTIREYIDKDYIIFLDRYTFSNMAHRGSRIKDKNERLKMFKWIEELEFNLLELPKPDLTIFLHMPYESACELKKNRKNLDEVEKDKEYLTSSETTYLELAKIYDFKTIECVKDNKIRSVEEISEDLYKIVKGVIK